MYCGRLTTGCQKITIIINLADLQSGTKRYENSSLAIRLQTNTYNTYHRHSSITSQHMALAASLLGLHVL